VLNGANEEAVAAFLRGEILFGGITERVEFALDRLAGLKADNLADIFEADRLARETVRSMK
jgi:1-deoxy-D-xylulose-5-phosphate reductoisomerase